jgi:hypothetical protein
MVLTRRVPSGAGGTEGRKRIMLRARDVGLLLAAGGVGVALSLHTPGTVLTAVDRSTPGMDVVLSGG